MQKTKKNTDPWCHSPNSRISTAPGSLAVALMQDPPVTLGMTHLGGSVGQHHAARTSEAEATLTGAERREWMGMGEWGNGILIHDSYGWFPHSLLSTSKKIRENHCSCWLKIQLRINIATAASLLNSLFHWLWAAVQKSWGACVTTVALLATKKD